MYGAASVGPLAAEAGVRPLTTKIAHEEMSHPVSNTALKWTPLLLLAGAHGWLVQSCVSGLNPLQLADSCSSPPLSTLGLLALSFIELTRGSRTRGAIALVVVAMPLFLRILGDVIN